MAAPSLLIVINNLNAGGAEQQLLGILPRLKQRGIDPAIFVLLERGSLAERFEAAKIPVYDGGRSLPSRGRFGQAQAVCGAALVLLRRLRRQPPEIVHFILPAAYLVGGLLSFLAPTPVRVMSRRSLNRYQRKHRLLGWIERRLHRRMTALVANSEAIQGELESEGAPATRVHLIRNGVDLDRFAGLQRDAVRRSLGIADAALVLITVANLIPYKGHADLIAALARIKNEMPAEWRLLCVGRDEGIGPALRAQAETAGIAGHIDWLGLRDDVPALLAAADIGLLCSYEEGFPNAVLEGMSAGLPIIATRVGGSVEAVQDGETGLLVPPGDAAGLGQAILALIRDPGRRVALGQAGRKRIEANFSLERCVDAYEALYRQLAGEICAD